MTPDHQRQENTPAENRLIESGQPGADAPAEPPHDLADLAVGEDGDDAQVDVLSE